MSSTRSRHHAGLAGTVEIQRAGAHFLPVVAGQQAYGSRPALLAVVAQEDVRACAHTRGRQSVGQPS